MDINSDVKAWLEVNKNFTEDDLREERVAPFPPKPLMQRVSGLTDERDFAEHGVHIFDALSRASPIPLHQFASIVDFGVGCGRLARMFKGFGGNYFGIDVDHELVGWVGRHLTWVQPVPSTPRRPLSLHDEIANCVISISVFTHMNEADCAMYLAELQRIAKTGAYVFLTVHGERALQRALTEKRIAEMLSVPVEEIRKARQAFGGSGFHFARQDTGHLTTTTYDYGVTFINEYHIRSVWENYFTLEQVISGAIHDFQDIVVLRK